VSTAAGRGQTAGVKAERSSLKTLENNKIERAERPAAGGGKSPCESVQKREKREERNKLQKYFLQSRRFFAVSQERRVDEKRRSR